MANRFVRTGSARGVASRGAPRRCGTASGKGPGGSAPGRSGGHPSRSGVPPPCRSRSAPCGHPEGEGSRLTGGQRARPEASPRRTLVAGSSCTAPEPTQGNSRVEFPDPVARGLARGSGPTRTGVSRHRSVRPSEPRCSAPPTAERHWSPLQFVRAAAVSAEEHRERFEARRGRTDGAPKVRASIFRGAGARRGPAADRLPCGQAQGETTACHTHPVPHRGERVGGADGGEHHRGRAGEGFREIGPQATHRAERCIASRDSGTGS